MPADLELTRLTATEAVSLLKRREVSSLELVDAAVARIEAVDERINALPIRFFEVAREQARQHDDGGPAAAAEQPGWLGGLPIAVKDFNNVAGQRTSCGSPIFEHNVAAVSDATVSRLLERGAVPIAKSNVPEFGGANTFNTLFGATCNPWNLARSAGGSSGGSAAALASGQVWLATGNDLGGSLRIPASFCGVAALRPSLGRVVRPEFMGTFDSMGAEGPMGRTVEDVALMLDAECGLSVHDPIAHPRPAIPYAQSVLQPCPRGLRIGYSNDLGLMSIDPEVARLCTAAAHRFTDAGAVVDDECPDFSGSIETFYTLRAQLFATVWGHLATDHPEKLPPWILQNFRKGLELSGAEIIAADRARMALYRRVAAFFTTHSVLALPAVALPPFPVDQKYPTELAGRPLTSYLDWMFLTFVTTLTSCPVMSVPCGLTADGLPVALQLIGPPQSEATLLQAARFLESTSGIVERLPLVA